MILSVFIALLFSSTIFTLPLISFVLQFLACFKLLNLESLRQEGYTESNITLITNVDKTYKELHNSTHAQIKLEDSPTEDYTLWEKIMHAFPIFSSKDYSNNPENAILEPEKDTLLEGYQKELDDGEIIVLVDDVFNKENALHLDQGDPKKYCLQTISLIQMKLFKILPRRIPIPMLSQ